MFHTRLHVPIPARKSPVPCSPPFTQHAASPHAPRSIGLHSTLHRLTLHAASPHTPRCINPPYSNSMFSPRVEGPSRPYSPSCPVCCDAIATCPRFPPAFRPLPACCPSLPKPSRTFRLASRLASCLSPSAPPPSRPVCCDVIATCPRFPPSSRLLPEPSRAFRPLPACCPLFPRLPPCCAALFLTILRPFLFPSRPVCRDVIATCPRFPPACLPLCPRFPSASLPPAWPQYRKSPPGLLSEGF